MSRFSDWYKAQDYSARRLESAWNAAIDAAIAEAANESYGHDPGDMADRMLAALRDLKTSSKEK